MKAKLLIKIKKDFKEELIQAALEVGKEYYKRDYGGLQWDGVPRIVVTNIKEYAQRLKKEWSVDDAYLEKMGFIDDWEYTFGFDLDTKKGICLKIEKTASCPPSYVKKFYEENTNKVLCSYALGEHIALWFHPSKDSVIKN